MDEWDDYYVYIYMGQGRNEQIIGEISFRLVFDHGSAPTLPTYHTHISTNPQAPYCNRTVQLVVPGRSAESVSRRSDISESLYVYISSSRYRKQKHITLLYLTHSAAEISSVSNMRQTFFYAVGTRAHTTRCSGRLSYIYDGKRIGRVR